MVTDASAPDVHPHGSSIDPAELARISEVLATAYQSLEAIHEELHRVCQQVDVAMENLRWVILGVEPVSDEGASDEGEDATVVDLSLCAPSSP